MGFQFQKTYALQLYLVIRTYTCICFDSVHRVWLVFTMLESYVFACFCFSGEQCNFTHALSIMRPGWSSDVWNYRRAIQWGHRWICILTQVDTVSMFTVSSNGVSQLCVSPYNVSGGRNFCSICSPHRCVGGLPAAHGDRIHAELRPSQPANLLACGFLAFRQMGCWKTAGCVLSVAGEHLLVQFI